MGRNCRHDRSQLEAASLSNSFGFQTSFGNCLEAKAVHQVMRATLDGRLSLQDFNVICLFLFYLFIYFFFLFFIVPIPDDHELRGARHVER